MRLIGRYAWHAQSLQVWLLQRCYLWFLPFPYPSIASVEDWKFQAKTMADQLVMVPYHWQRARDNGAFTSQNLLELSKFRDRVGWKFAFMKSCILSGLMAAKASRGISMKLKTAALEEARAAVEKEKKQGHQMQAAGELIGPRGGLPTLKADLIKLALLCDVPVLDSDTVPTLQAKIRPVVATIRSAEPNAAAKTSSRASTANAPAARLAEPKAAASVPQAESIRSSSPELMTATQMSELMDNKLHGASWRYSGARSEASDNDGTGDVTHRRALQEHATGDDAHAGYGNAIWSDSGRLSDGRLLATIDAEVKIPASLNVKTGVRQMITQAWQPHCRDQLAVSTNAAETNEIFNTTWMSEMKAYEKESCRLSLAEQLAAVPASPERQIAVTGFQALLSAPPPSVRFFQARRPSASSFPLPFQGSPVLG